MRINRFSLKWTRTILVILLLGTTFCFSTLAQTNPNDQLDEEGLGALVEKLKTVLAEQVEDEETQTSITEKWDARMEKLVGKTVRQVVELLLADVKSVIKDAEIINQLKENFTAAVNDSEPTTQPEPPEPSEKPLNKPNPPTQPNSNRTLGQYIRGLNYNPVSLLAVQSTGNQPMFEKVLNRGEMMRKPGSGTITRCTRTPKNLSRNYDEIAILQPTRGVIYSGALIFADKELVNGSPRPLTGLPRVPLNLRLDLPGSEDNGKFTVDDPTEDNVQSAVNQALDSWNNSSNFQNGYVNQSRSNHNSTIVYSSAQFALGLGFNELWAQGPVSAQFRNTSDSEKNVVAVALKQVFYSITVDSPQTPEGFFDSSVTAEQAQAVFSSTSVPGYISSINYGRIIMFRMETDKSTRAIDAEAALQYAAGLVSVGGEMKTKYDNILKTSEITAVTFGANGQVETENVSAGALIAIIRGKNAVYSKSNPGVPISYTVKFLKDNAVAKLGTATDYVEEKCETLNNLWIEIRQNGAYMADYTVTWDEPGNNLSAPAVQKKEEGRYSAGNKMQVNFPGDATNIRVNLRTMSGWGILDTVLLPADLNKCYQTFGVATGPGWNNDCR